MFPALLTIGTANGLPSRNGENGEWFGWCCSARKCRSPCASSWHSCIVLGLIGVIAGRCGASAPAGLAAPARAAASRGSRVIDYASVDGRRRLILVRRDNVEHLLMIGGPTDVVVEPNIVRAVAAPRDVALARPAAVIEPLPRAIPLPDNGNGSWPLQPEVITAAAARPAPKIEPASDEAPAWPPLQPQADTPPAAPAGRNAIRWRRWPTNFRRVRHRRRRRAVFARRLRRARRLKRAPNRASRAARRTAARPRCRRHRRRHPQTPRRPIKASPRWRIASKRRCASPMLRPKRARPRRNRARVATSRPEPRQAQPAEQAAAPEPPPAPPQPRAARPAEPKPARSAPPAKPPQSTTLYDNLEQEMASLLGRPTNKS